MFKGKAKAANIFIDLDGPILDVSEKYYQVYRSVVLTLGGRPLGKNRYWHLKRNKFSLPKLLEMSAIYGDKNTLLFKSHWLSLIERKAFLAYDKPWPHIKGLLRCLKNRYRLVLATLRRRKPNLDWQLERFELGSYFNLVLCQNGNQGGWMDKYKLIKESGVLEASSVLVGDTEIDILAGRRLGIKTIALLCGLRCRDVLALYKPDYILSSLNEARKLM